MSPVLFDACGVRTYWYGAAYAFGFIAVNLWVLARRRSIEWSLDEAYDFSLCFALGVLACGRAFDALFYEWGYYGRNPAHLFALWQGGMATHGVLIGAILGTALFCRIRGRSFLAVCDRLAPAACLFMALGRVGNHLNGEVYGYPTGLPWGMAFPYASGWRHPVALYDSLKNLLLIPLLLAVRRSPRYRRGLVTAHFLFWYASLRFLVDCFREYDSYWLGIGRGQYFNIAMALCGLAMMIRVRRRGEAPAAAGTIPRDVEMRANRAALWAKSALFYLIVVFSLTIPSGWTQAVLEMFRNRSAA